MSLIGKKAPDFKLPAVVGDGEFKDIALADFKGKWVVLFFYPLDFTFVCPTEIQEYSKREKEFRDAGAVVLGASIDSVHSHKAWIQGNLGKLTYPLISDLNKTLSRDYDCLLEDAGISCRATFIINPEGKVVHASYNDNDIGRSVSESLRLLQAAQTGERCPVEWKPGAKTLGK